MTKHIILATALFSTTMIVACDEGSPAPEAELDQEAEPGSVDVDAAIIDAGQLDANELACGDKTLASIVTENNDHYVFCATPDGDSIVIESLWDGAERESLLEQIQRPADVLRAVYPVGEEIPAALLDALEVGAVDFANSAFPIRRGRVDPTLPVFRATCSTPDLGFTVPGSYDPEFVTDTTECGFVHAADSSAHNEGYHQRTSSLATVALNHGMAGPHLPPEYYYADEDETDQAARYGRAKVHSCGGTTTFEGWWRGAPGVGSWEDMTTYNVPSGSVYLMKWYGNPQHSLWMGYDSDDMRFKATATGGSSFGSNFFFAKFAWGTSCDLVY
ncbi:MAG TPA: hypothetical protein VM869_25605 [Enhygromyxa sp.]|nr:hypothetical protein [Enhygromyxa sp.]